MAYFTLKISRDILKETLLKFRKIKIWPFVLSVIEMYFAAESLSAKYLFDSHKEFENCLSEVIKCFDDLKIGDKESIKVRLKDIHIFILLLNNLFNELNDVDLKLSIQNYLFKDRCFKLCHFVISNYIRLYSFLSL